MYRRPAISDRHYRPPLPRLRATAADQRTSGGPVPMTSGSIANRLAGAFFCAWLAIAFAGGDHPPPPGFLLLAGLLLACALLVRLRVPTYLRWQREQASGRIGRVIRDGAAGGAAAYLFMLVLGSGEP